MTNHCSPDIVEAKRLIRGLLSYADGYGLRGKYADELSNLTTEANNFLKRPGVAQTIVNIDLLDEKVVEEAAIDLHRAVDNYTSGWEYENPKLKDHYRAKVRNVFATLNRIASLSSSVAQTTLLKRARIFVELAADVGDADDIASSKILLEEIDAVLSPVSSTQCSEK